jgi:hypothetical protein
MKKHIELGMKSLMPFKLNLLKLTFKYLDSTIIYKVLIKIKKSIYLEDYNAKI